VRTRAFAAAALALSSACVAGEVQATGGWDVHHSTRGVAQVQSGVAKDPSPAVQAIARVETQTGTPLGQPELPGPSATKGPPPVSTPPPKTSVPAKPALTAPPPAPATVPANGPGLPPKAPPKRP